MKNIKILLADDNREFCDVISKYLEKQDDMEVVGIANDGIEVLDMLSKIKPDVIILDIIMPNLDGVAVMEQLSTHDLDQPPKIIVLSAVGQDKVIQRAIALGADYYMLKPLDMKVFVRRIREVVWGFSSGFEKPVFSINQSAQNFTATASQPYEHDYKKQPSIEAVVANVIYDMGIPVHFKGYQYLKEAILLVIDNMDLLGRITKELYPMIAEKFSTTPSRVERAIRHAIEVAWNRGRVDAINRVFGYVGQDRNDKPTNGEFNAVIADRIRLQIKFSGY